MEKSFMEGHITTLSAVDTVADGCAVKTPGDLTYASARSIWIRLLPYLKWKLCLHFCP